MAKQKGIHQLKGKVGEMSYYQQKGVSGGLVRKINEGMSARVKIGEEYANTRLNNAEFKNANAIAVAAFNSVNTRKRGMLRTFAVASMTKRALEDIKHGSGKWGVRLPQTELDVLICDMLENYAKGGKYDGQFGDYSEVSLSNAGQVTITGKLSVATQTSLKELGIDGFQMVVSKCLAGEILVDGAPRLFSGAGILPLDPFIIPSEIVDVDTPMIFSVATPSSVGMSPSGYAFANLDEKHGFFAVITILPFHLIGDSRYILQEYCTYVALPLGQIPEP